MREEITEEAGWVGLEYVSVRVRSHIRIVASVEPVATMLSSICKQRTEARELGKSVKFVYRCVLLIDLDIDLLTDPKLLLLNLMTL